MCRVAKLLSQRLRASCESNINELAVSHLDILDVRKS